MPSSGRYQSKVLSFLSQQSLKWRDRLTQTFRHTQIAAVWGTQILLYPVYALFQSTRLVGKQLRQSVRQILPKLLAGGRSPDSGNLSGDLVTSDTPLQQILATVQTFKLPIDVVSADPVTVVQSTDQSTDQSTPTRSEQLTVYVGNVAIVSQPTSRLTVRGIASAIATRHLVLVTPQNETLDILTIEQQKYLFQCLIWELASFWRTQRQLRSTHRVRSTFLPLPIARETQLPPVRWFNRLMVWLQTSPVAAATNLFHEAELVQYLQEQWHDQRLGLPMQPQPAQLKAAPPDAMPAASRWWHQTRQMILAWVKGQAAFPASADPWQAASSASSPLSFSTQQHQPAPPLVDRPRLSASQTPNRLAGWTYQLKVWAEQVLSSPDPALNDRGAIAPAQPAPLTQTSTYSRAIAPPTTSPAGLRSGHSTTSLTSPSETDELTENLTYIETKATLVGYEKHPLERILQWLDFTMLWVEQAIGRVWQWFSRSK